MAKRSIKFDPDLNHPDNPMSIAFARGRMKIMPFRFDANAVNDSMFITFTRWIKIYQLSSITGSVSFVFPEEVNGSINVSTDVASFGINSGAPISLAFNNSSSLWHYGMPAQAPMKYPIITRKIILVNAATTGIRQGIIVYR
jgi:hypothetical protein